MPRSPFTDDWHDLQTAQFAHTMRTGNATQRAAAVAVMREAGYSDDQIRGLYINATMHSDDVPPDFEPDMDIIEAGREVQHPADCQCARCHTPQGSSKR
jgi:hypothetical protein